MKKILTLLFLFSAFLLCAQSKVLFVGNSYTFMNDMTATFEAIANANGSPVSVTQHALGGASLGDHVANEDLVALFDQGGWDYVVIQPKTAESLGNIPIETTLAHAKTLKSNILEKSPCAKILFYEATYGYLNPANAGNLDNYNSLMNTMRDNIHYLAEETKTFFAPGGEAMRRIWNEDQSINLWIASDEDQIHPNARGSYIIACAIYDAVFQKNVTGNSFKIDELSTAEANIYQSKIDDLVLNNLEEWLINTYNQHTNFEYSVEGFTVNFSSASANYDNLKWDFGDDTFSNLAEITHTYSQAKTYTVTLTTNKNSCEESLSEQVAIMPVGVHNSENIKINIFPNPCLDRLMIENYIGKIRIFNTIGLDLTNLISTTKLLNGMSLNISRLPKGEYILQMDSLSKEIQKL